MLLSQTQQKMVVLVLDVVASGFFGAAFATCPLTAAIKCFKIKNFRRRWDLRRSLRCIPSEIK
jgi:hypothetical protein